MCMVFHSGVAFLGGSSKSRTGAKTMQNTKNGMGAMAAIAIAARNFISAKRARGSGASVPAAKKSKTSHFPARTAFI